MAIDKELLDQLLVGRDPQELFAQDGLIDELKKALSERMLAAELDDHLGSEANAGVANRRNGSSKKTMLTGTSKVTRHIPRDRSGTFDAKLIAKRQRRFPDFDDKIVSMHHARGMTVTCATSHRFWRTALSDARLPPHSGHHGQCRNREQHGKGCLWAGIPCSPAPVTGLGSMNHSCVRSTSDRHLKGSIR